MAKLVKRRYNSERRTASAVETRRAILQSARKLFLKHGYAATTISSVAEGADVALDTVYVTIGRKIDLFRLLLETAISGSDEPIDALNRDYVIAIRKAKCAHEKLRIYSRALSSIAPRLSPVHAVLKAAAQTEPGLSKLWNQISTRRAENMRLLARDLLKTGELRDDLDLATVADILWSMNGPEYYALLVTERGWSVAAFGEWLFSAWCRLLLVSP